MSTSKLETYQNHFAANLIEQTRALNALLKRQGYHAPETGNTGRAAEWSLGRQRGESKISTGVYLVGIIWVTTISLGYLAIVIR